MEQRFQINSSKDLRKLFDIREKNLKEFMNEAIESEFDLLEFNLFISSLGKKNLDSATKKVRELRKKIDKREIDLSEYENILDDY
jgi:hypothetical protein